MTRGNILQKSDIQKHSRRNALSLSYHGKVRARVARLHGQDENTFFVVNLPSIPIPDEIEELAQQAGTTLANSPTEDSFRKLVADAIIAEAIENAPEHLFEITGVSFSWPDSSLVSLERDTREREERVESLIREVKFRLRSKLSEKIPVFEWVPPSFEGSPAQKEGSEQAKGAKSRAQEADEQEPARKPHAAPEPELAAADDSMRPSEAVMAKVREAVKIVREKDVPQRLPAGARKSVDASAPAPLVWTGSKAVACASLEEAIAKARAHSLKKIDTAVIDWDGEQPVLVRRFASGGATTYRCEDSVRPARAEATADVATAAEPSDPAA